MAEIKNIQEAARQKVKAEQSKYGDLKPGYNALELLKADFPPAEFLTEQMPVGVNLLSARMKSGKSYYSLNLAIQAATGGKYLSRFNVIQCPVLYLDLELPDSKSKKRLENCLAFSDRHDLKLADLHIYPRGSWPRMGTGGMSRLKTFVKEHAIKLLIIDTWPMFQAIRPPKEQFNYQLDYEDIGRIKNLSEKYHLCVILTLHLNKSWKTQETPFDAIYGSTGIAAAADNLFALTSCSGSSEADLLLWGRGRDIDDFKFALKRHREDYSFQYLGDSIEFELEETQRLIYQTIKEVGRPMTPAEIAAALEKNLNTVQTMLIKMEVKGIIKKPRRGEYDINL
jgi:RecA-family ATPase